MGRINSIKSKMSFVLLFIDQWDAYTLSAFSDATLFKPEIRSHLTFLYSKSAMTWLRYVLKHSNTSITE